MFSYIGVHRCTHVNIYKITKGVYQFMNFSTFQLQVSIHSTEFIYYCDLLSANNLVCGSMNG